jgi:hypothetical protein
MAVPPHLQARHSPPVVVPLLLHVSLLLLAAPAADAARPNVTRLGTWDLGMVETTPVNVKGRLLLYVESTEQPCPPSGCRDRAAPVPADAGGNLRFIDVLSGETVGAPFGHGEGLGCAMWDEASETMYVYATLCVEKEGHCTVEVYSSTDATLTSWKQSTAIDAIHGAWNNKTKTTLWNTSVGKGKIKGKDMWVMAFETDISYWTTRFAVAEHPAGPWEVLDVEEAYIVSPTLETADPTLRYSEADGYWYCFTGRKAPAAWFFFMEVFRAKEITGPWEPAPQMGNASEVGVPMLAATTPADVAADKAMVPQEWKGGARYDFMKALEAWWTTADDVNNSDLDRACAYHCVLRAALCRTAH